MRSLISLVVAVSSIASGCSPGALPPLEPRVADPPAADGSVASDVTTGADGRVYLSWIEPAGGETHRLRFSTWDGDGWSAPRTVAAGDGWFVNWADFPSMAALADGTLAAHWLVRSDESSYAYDVLLAVSSDGGASWSEPTAVHADRTQTEHGFVSLLPANGDEFHVIWLDGRELAGADHGGGAMTLRAARFERNGLRSGPESLIDSRVCDCCQTDAVLAAGGTPVVVYRDRTDDEVRDISIVRREDDAWSEPVAVHHDDWRMPACPVNGPAVDHASARLAAAWFTAPDGSGRVQVAFSDDGGRTFGPPVRLGGDRAVGRVDLVMLDDGSALVSWLEESRLSLQRVGPNGTRGPIHAVARTSNERAAGFPRMTRAGELLFLTWTEPAEPSRVRAAVVALADL
ncbi:MAG TPA: sialidase family protein [Candidatus Polarisedimenticolaceae bacterium]|nr:sialidase family protein [Candidatus Polarisedimenticolaceae bacterium]